MDQHVDAPIDIGVRPELLTDTVHDAILRAIVQKVLPAGSRVTEAGLAARLNVSKTPVREALLKLREIGLIEPDGYRGGRIVRPSRAAIGHAYDVREALESFTARTVAAKGDAVTIRELSRAAKNCAAAARLGDFAGFSHWDDVFHWALVAATHNPQLERLVQNSLTLVSALRRRDVSHREGSVECADMHIAVVKAIELRDVVAAGQLMSDHVRQVCGLVLADFDDGHLDDGPSVSGT
jgi:DNA-binding GntR family transcriptional regulator